ncbi:Late competence development protein ComFB [Treponema brennaborense DSM 12168]|uniref:Late competence development protein ComFB n=1 Tax=Treponema brennaborense (strain DSM 12168 / CIP 105900 / DD5/3) TaxID=906968 RepID=F4LKY9_TREBD|nr:Late competence development protein ComFB [Treponema brennaborense DSM 12168]
MTVHNIMEDRVAERVDALYEAIQKEHPGFLSCDCESCRADTLCYVLNRIPAKYIVSDRGVTYSSLAGSTQLKADIDALVIEGMKIVNTAKRPYHKEKGRLPNVPKTPAFVFPACIGTVYDGHTFEPIPNAQITILCNGKNVQMEDITWSNPCYTYQSTQGTYSFKPAAVPAEKPGVSTEFSFTVEITADGYEPHLHSFTIPVTSGGESAECFSIRLQDSYLFMPSEDADKQPN